MTLETYTAWGKVPDNLKTKTQLSKLGKRLAKGQQPVAKKTGGKGPFDLYDIAAAIDKRQPTEAQLGALEKAQAAADKAKHCAHCSARIYKRGRWRRYNHADGYICAECFARNEEHIDAQRLLTQPFVVLDTETTGLDEAAQIVSIAIIDHTGAVLLNTLVRPTISIPAEAISIHGITDEMVANEPTMADLYDKLRILLNNRIVVMYNADFDTRMLDQSVRFSHKRPVTPPDEWGMDTYCAMESCKAYLGRDHWLSLTSAAEYFGLDTAGAHGALADCRMTLDVVKGMAGVLASE
jgi:DNA polymerase III epsilon subunit-like protein